jgi:hypothetical protein
LSSILTEPLSPESLDTRDALLKGESGDVLTVESRRLVEAVGHPDNALDHAASMAYRRHLGQAVGLFSAAVS